jgi:hypothetical protein
MKLMKNQITTRTLEAWPEPVETSELDSRDRDLELSKNRQGRAVEEDRIIVEVWGLVILIVALAAAAVWLLARKVALQWPFGP